MAVQTDFHLSQFHLTWQMRSICQIQSIYTTQRIHVLQVCLQFQLSLQLYRSLSDYNCTQLRSVPHHQITRTVQLLTFCFNKSIKQLNSMHSLHSALSVEPIPNPAVYVLGSQIYPHVQLYSTFSMDNSIYPITLHSHTMSNSISA